MKRFFGNGWALALVAVSSLVVSGIVASYLPTSTALAVGGTTYTLFSPDNDEAKRQIKNELTEDGIGNGNGGLEQTKIYSKGGPFGAGMFDFNRDFSNKYDTPTYTRQVYCTLPPEIKTPGKCSFEEPADTVTYIKFLMALGITPRVGSDFLKKDNYRAVVGAWNGDDDQKRIHLGAILKPVDSSERDVPALDKDLSAKGKINRDYNMYRELTIQYTATSDDEINANLAPYGLTETDVNNKIAKQVMINIADGSASVTNFQKLSPGQKEDWLKFLEANDLGDPEETAASAASGGASGETGTNCQGGPMGWLFCPMIDYMTGALQISAKLIDNLMQVRFLSQAGGSIKIEQAWRAFLSLANIILVIAFMIIVFSQSTGAGLSNYGVKRMLPRLVIAAILMNVSFYICALAIDVSNIVGASIMGLFIGDGSVSGAIVDATGGEGGNSIIGGALGGALLIGLLFLVLTPVVLSIIVVFVMLIARQLILLCLVLAAPLAFAAWLLPNTEKYFKKWSELFTQLLVLYPVAMAIFGASLYFANFLGGGGQAIDLGVENDTLRPILIKIIQLIVLCIPLIALPMLLKSSSSIMGKIGSAANKIGAATAGKATDKISAGAKGFAKDRALNTEMRAAGLSGPNNKYGRAGRVVGRAGNFRAKRAAKKGWAESERKRAQQEALGQYLEGNGDVDLAAKRAASFAGAAGSGGADRVAAWAAGQSKERFGEAMKLEEAKLSSSSTAELGRVLEGALKSGNAATAYAASSLLNQKGGPGTAMASDVINNVAENEAFGSDAAKLAAGVVRSNGKEFNASNPSLTRWADQDPSGTTTQTLEQVSQDAGTYTNASAEKMATWSDSTIDNAHIVASRAGGAELAKLQKQSQELLGSRQAESLSPVQRAAHEAILKGKHYLVP